MNECGCSCLLNTYVACAILRKMSWQNAWTHPSVYTALRLFLSDNIRHCATSDSTLVDPAPAAGLVLLKTVPQIMRPFGPYAQHGHGKASVVFRSWAMDLYVIAWLHASTASRQPLCGCDCLQYLVFLAVYTSSLLATSGPLEGREGPLQKIRSCGTFSWPGMRMISNLNMRKFWGRLQADPITFS